MLVKAVYSFYPSRFHNSPKQMCALHRPHEPHSATALTSTRFPRLPRQNNMQLRSHIQRKCNTQWLSERRYESLSRARCYIFWFEWFLCVAVLVSPLLFLFFLHQLLFFFFLLCPLLKFKQTHCLIVDTEGAAQPRIMHFHASFE